MLAPCRTYLGTYPVCDPLIPSTRASVARTARVQHKRSNTHQVIVFIHYITGIHSYSNRHEKFQTLAPLNRNLLLPKNFLFDLSDTWSLEVFGNLVLDLLG